MTLHETAPGLGIPRLGAHRNRPLPLIRPVPEPSPAATRPPGRYRVPSMHSVAHCSEETGDSPSEEERQIHRQIHTKAPDVRKALPDIPDLDYLSRLPSPSGSTSCGRGGGAQARLPFVPWRVCATCSRVGGCAEQGRARIFARRSAGTRDGGYQFSDSNPSQSSERGRSPAAATARDGAMRAAEEREGTSRQRQAGGE